MEIILFMILMGFIFHEAKPAETNGHFHEVHGQTVYSNCPKSKSPVCQNRKLALENYDRFDVLV